MLLALFFDLKVKIDVTTNALEKGISYELITRYLLDYFIDGHLLRWLAMPCCRLVYHSYG